MASEYLKTGSYGQTEPAQVKPEWVGLMEAVEVSRARAAHFAKRAEREFHLPVVCWLQSWHYRDIQGKHQKDADKLLSQAIDYRNVIDSAERVLGIGSYVDMLDLVQGAEHYLSNMYLGIENNGQ